MATDEGLEGHGGRARSPSPTWAKLKTGRSNERLPTGVGPERAELSTMSTIITVDCQACGDEIPFEVEAWATAPTRAYCDEACYERSVEAPTPTARAR